MQIEGKNRHDALSDAAKYLRAALELLDGASAPAQIGAHVDLAICQLESELDDSSSSPVLRQAVH